MVGGLVGGGQSRTGVLKCPRRPYRQEAWTYHSHPANQRLYGATWIATGGSNVNR